MAKIAPPAPPFIAARHHGGSQTPSLIVMHGTVSHDDPGTARQIANWWHGPTSPDTSAHYVRDPRETIQCVGDHNIAYHCGFNYDSVGYELCDEQVGPATRWNDADSQAILAGAAEDVARLHLAYGIPIRFLTDKQLYQWNARGRHAADGGIVTHAQMSRVFKKSTHTDPRDWPAAKFLVLVEAAAATLQLRPAVPVPASPHIGLAKPKPSKKVWGGFLHLPASRVWEEDSIRGVKAAARRKGNARAIDINGAGRTKDGVLVALHYAQPLLHGFRWDKTTPAYLRALDKTVNISDLTFAETRHLVAGRNYRICKLSTLFALAARLGVRVEFEPKGAATFFLEATWREIAGWAGTKSLRRRDLLQVKRLVLIPGAARCLGAAHAVGFETIVSTTGAPSNVLSLKRYSGKADYVRGSVRWAA
jgi:hypothetical protein